MKSNVKGYFEPVKTWGSGRISLDHERSLPLVPCGASRVRQGDAARTRLSEAGTI